MSEPTVVRFARSARRHRIGKAHVLHVINTIEPQVIAADGDSQERLLGIGPDDRGLDLEIVAIAETELLLVIHAMPHHFRRSRS